MLITSKFLISLFISSQIFLQFFGKIKVIWIICSWMIVFMIFKNLFNLLLLCRLTQLVFAKFSIMIPSLVVICKITLRLYKNKKRINRFLIGAASTIGEKIFILDHKILLTQTKFHYRTWLNRDGMLFRILNIFLFNKFTFQISNNWEQSYKFSMVLQYFW